VDIPSWFPDAALRRTVFFLWICVAISDSQIEELLDESDLKAEIRSAHPPTVSDDSEIESHPLDSQDAVRAVRRIQFWPTNRWVINEFGRMEFLQTTTPRSSPL
jgi:hypothetical protein